MNYNDGVENSSTSACTTQSIFAWTEENQETSAITAGHWTEI
jgi:hypothetical protein